MKTADKQYRIDYKEQFIKDVQAHKKTGNKSILLKINNLIEELREHPTIGTGNPEPLIGDRKGQWSRRITSRHRLVYEIKKML